MMLKSIERHLASHSVPYSCPWVSDMIADIETEIAERFIELPEDADGVKIRVGDLLEYDYGDCLSGIHRVEALIYNDRWDFEFDDDDSSADSRCVADMRDFYRCNHHVNQRTVEDVLCDFRHGDLTIEGAEIELRELLGGDCS